MASSQERYDYVGSYNVNDGPRWGGNPPTYSPREACAEVFGGNTDQYVSSASRDTVTGTGYLDGWGDERYCSDPADQDFKKSDNYDCGSSGCSYSAYVSDHSCTSTNYCFKISNPDFCNFRGPKNECIMNQTNELQEQKYNISSVFESRSNAVFEAFNGVATLNLTNSSRISGLWRGAFNLDVERPVLQTGAEFRPEGRIVIGR